LLQAAGREHTEALAELAPAAVDEDAGAAPRPAETDRLTGRPVLPRFPWLSQRSSALEEAARRRAAFGPGPVLGEFIDTSA
jgi:hypothetical protein